jgi:hypothetical protein
MGGGSAPGQSLAVREHLVFQNKLKFAALLAVGASFVWGQTQVDLRTQSKTVDFSAAPETRPVKTGSALPATCNLGDMYFLTTAPAGANLYACVSVNTWSLQSGAGGPGGSVTVDSSGTLVGTRSTDNYIGGPGLIDILSDTGTAINIQQNVDTSYLLTRSQFQAGNDVALSCTSGNATAYTCAPVGNALPAYTDQQRLGWKPDVSCGAAPTINVSFLGAVPVYRSDGTAIQAGDCQAGAQVTIWYDGTANSGAGGFKLTNSKSFANPLTTEGDVLYQTGGAASRLGLGTRYQVLQAGAVDPFYGPVSLGQSAAVTGVLGSANGGTGVNNGSSTLTLGGNLTTAGAFASTVTVTGATNVTLPTSGTLMTTGSSVGLAQTPLTTLGDTIYVNATPGLARLPGNTTSTLNVLTQTGTGSVSAAPAWQSATAAGIAPFSFQSVTFSATPAFTLGSGANTFKITLTGNVTSSTIGSASAGQGATFLVCQDATGSRTFTWPASFKGAMTIGSTASKCNIQSFAYDGTTFYATGTGMTSQ